MMIDPQTERPTDERERSDLVPVVNLFFVCWTDDDGEFQVTVDVMWMAAEIKYLREKSNG